MGEPSGDCAVGPCPSGAVMVYSGVSAAPLYSITSETAGDEFGLSVAPLGDIDGDGTPDFAVAAPERRPGGAGRVTLYSGRSGTSIRTITGNGGAFGTSIASIGDMDADGRSDLVVGAPDLDGDNGAAYVFSSATGALLTTLHAPRAHSRLGQTVGGCGDWNGDGIPDPLVTAPDGALGSVMAFSGAGGSLLYEADSLSFWSGSSLAAMDDQDHDGRCDFVVGVPGGVLPGYVAIHSGRTGAMLRQVDAPGSPWFGASVGTEYWSDPSYPDVAVGDPGAGSIGAVHLYWSSLYLQRSFFGETWDSEFGASLAVGGDANGDGRGDLLVGAPGTVRGDRAVGAAYVLYLVETVPAHAWCVSRSPIRLGAGASEVCFRVDATGNYDQADVVRPSLVLRLDPPDSRELRALPGSSGVIGDSNGDFIPEMSACFSRAELRDLFSGYSTGRHDVPVLIESILENGSRVSAPVVLTIEVPAVMKPSVVPNPIAAQGTLGFRTSTPGVVRVDLFDAHGRLARTLMPGGTVPAGYHSVTLDGRDATGERLSSGVYFYRIQSPDGIVSGRFVYLKQ